MGYQVVIYLTNIVMGMLQFDLATRLFGYKQKLWKIAVSSILVLSIYSFTVYLTSLWMLAFVYNILLLATFLVLLKIPFQKAVTMVLVLQIFSDCLEYVMMFVLDQFEYNILHSMIYEADIYMWAKLATTLLWVIVYFVIRKVGTGLFLENGNYSTGWRLTIKIVIIVLLISPSLTGIEQGQIIVPMGTKLYYILIVLGITVYGLYNIHQSHNLERAAEQLSKEQVYSATMKRSYDKLRSFKHSQANILLSMRGLAEQGRFEELKDLIDQRLREIKSIHTYETASVNLKNMSYLYGIIVAKLQDAEVNDIDFQVNLLAERIFIPDISSADVCNMVGILLDNALEGALQSEEKQVRMIISERYGRMVFRISNSYDGQVRLSSIGKDGVTSKKNHMGIGLYDIQQTKERYQKKNISIKTNTTYEDGEFVQELVL